MSRPFFSRRLPFFGNRAMLVLCAIFFLLPFVLRGAREAINSMKNDVADWLPKDFPETVELRRFRKHFIGDQFVVISWEGCVDGGLLKDKIYKESEDWDQWRRDNQLAKWDPAEERHQKLAEELEARQWANELALHTTGNFHEDWGEHNEKWLLGRNHEWYFVNKDGNVFKWDGRNNLIHGVGRGLQRFFNGKNQATGTFVKQFGEEGEGNRFYEDPTLLCARFFSGVTTGPDIFEKMAGPEGTMILGRWSKGDANFLNAEIETHKRLTGVLFGPTPDPEFDWTVESLKRVIPAEKWAQLRPAQLEQFEIYKAGLIQDLYGGDPQRLLDALPEEQLEHWYRLWALWNIDAPPRQTCLVVTLNEPVLDDLARAVGRPVMNKPRGRLLELATGQCGIKPDNLHIGGPPVDNVAIDEEGAITLFRLVSLSAIIGITLAYLSFRSIRVTLMVFFVGGVSAVSSLGFVWFGGSTMDAILMTMPSLVYVLGLSGAVHVVNYYRDACQETGQADAAERAVKLGLFPCSLAAFTTALGLISLCTSNLEPIKKFGLFSAVATLATVVLLFTYLPASLTIWPPRYGRVAEAQRARRRGFNLSALVGKFWSRVGDWVVSHHTVVTIVAMVLMGYFAWGITKIETSVQLLKLFRSDAKILRDYAWMEEKMGKLVPMELVLTVDADMQRMETDTETPAQDLQNELRLSMLQRMELSDRVRTAVIRVFGDQGKKDVGNSMSSDLASPLKFVVGTHERGLIRTTVNGELLFKRESLLEQDYLRVDLESLEEMWRISLRLAALNNVDYGQFVSELKTVVEPIMAAYRFRFRLLKTMQEALGEASKENGSILVIGPLPPPPGEENGQTVEAGEIDQTFLFSSTLRDLIENAGYRAGRTNVPKRFSWLDPSQQLTAEFWTSAAPTAAPAYDCILLIEEREDVSVELISQNAKRFIDARNHTFVINEKTKTPLEGMLTAAQRKASGDPDSLITTSYTGIVPIVYKAQRALLRSLIISICLAFAMIACVMMVLLRPWGNPLRLHNALNFRAGLLSMLPNIFPVVIIFGAMGHMRNLVDIGSMMTASVAMGVAVDDTIHFLTWFRQGMSRGLSRLQAIKLSYSKVATAMTQTTLIGGLGLSAFAFSTFMPTQRFGVLMLYLLVAALVGDLILLPALLAGPLGKYFTVKPSRAHLAGSENAPAPETAEETRDPADMSRRTETGDLVKTPYMVKRRGTARGASENLGKSQT